MPCRSGFVRCLGPHGFHRMAYRDWGASVAPTVIAVHGLTRNGRDFDRLATGLEDHFRIVCPDVVGRGESDHLPDGAAYGLPQYAGDMTTLIAALGAYTVDWVGTSMGGLIGMLLAAQPGTPIRRLVINDVGPFLPKAALERIGGYVGIGWRFATIEEAEAHMRKAYAPFGALSDADWRFLTEISVRAGGEGGGFVPNYDLKIAAPFTAGPASDLDLWALWDRIACPVLVLRGAESDLLMPDTAAEMARRGPKTEIVEIPGCGHAPALLDASQIGIVRDWLGRA